MPVRVLVVDDSGFFRRRVCDMLNADPRLQVIGTAADGGEAVSRVRELRPDVVTMDVEMPVMNGIEAVRRIMASTPTPILMFSSVTHEGARFTLEALEAGALDFLPKFMDQRAHNGEDPGQILRERVLSLARPARAETSLRAAQPAGARRAAPVARSGRLEPRLIIIGTSTGGPVALQRVLTALPAGFSLPLLLVQHMPPGFTAPFAARLNQLAALSVSEAHDGDSLRPGHALVAPGGKQTTVLVRGDGPVVRVSDSGQEQRYRPCIDLTFTSASECLPGRVLGVVLTGMGADGREGARLLKQTGSSIWAQDAATSIIYGMPMAVAEAGLADRILPLDEIGVQLSRIH